MKCWFCGKNTMQELPDERGWFKCTTCGATWTDNSKVGTGQSGRGAKEDLGSGLFSYRSKPATKKQKEKAQKGK